MLKWKKFKVNMKKTIRPCFNLEGETFGHWEVLYRVDCPAHICKHKKNKAYWLCKCSCGHKSIVLGSSLRSGRSLSCGCQIIFKNVNKTFF